MLESLGYWQRHILRRFMSTYKLDLAIFEWQNVISRSYSIQVDLRLLCQRIVLLVLLLLESTDSTLYSLIKCLINLSMSLHNNQASSQHLHLHKLYLQSALTNLRRDQNQLLTSLANFQEWDSFSWKKGLYCQWREEVLQTWQGIRLFECRALW